MTRRLNHRIMTRWTLSAQAAICMASFTEKLPYPTSAKYHMNLCGIATEEIVRVPNCGEMNEYARFCMRQMKLLTDEMEKKLGI